MMDTAADVPPTNESAYGHLKPFALNIWTIALIVSNSQFPNSFCFEEPVEGYLSKSAKVALSNL
jgi:hypothetical protein